MLTLVFSSHLCRPFRALPSGCRQCAEACPAGVLSVDGAGVTVAEGCQACGRCAAACPAGALVLPAFPTPNALLDAAPTVIDCRRVPTRLSGGALRVPCLGGLDEAHLLALHRAAGCRSVQLVDRGWCPDCPAGGAGEHPVAGALRRANALLEAIGTEPADRLRLDRVPASPGLRQDEAPALPARRALFGRMLGGTGAARAVPAKEGAEAPSRPRRTRSLDMLARIQEHRGKSLPGALYPELRVADACTHCGVCQALCPTRALTSFEEGGASGLSFDAARCIACGRCVEVCQAGAVRLDARAEGTAPSGRMILTHRATRACLRCETEFAGDGDGTERFCPRCRLAHGLLTHAPGRATTGSGPAAVHG